MMVAASGGRSLEQSGDYVDSFGYVQDILGGLHVMVGVSYDIAGVREDAQVQVRSVIIIFVVLQGFVRATGFYEKKKKEAVYQLADYYTLFYFKYIRNNYGKDEHYWVNATENPTRRTWSGHAFEQVCMDHISQIKYKLQIGGVLSKEYAWSISADEEKGITGAQIDLLIDRRDHVVSICEMKYSVNKFGIDKGYDEDLRNKIDSFVNATDCKKTVQLVMVTTYGLKPSKYNSLVNAEVELDDLFYPV